MPIVVEPTEDFKNIPLGRQESVKKYILDRKFSSLDDIFSQQDEHGDYVMSDFCLAEKKIIPQNLPEIITEVDIVARWPDNQGGHYEYVALKAKCAE